nr:ATP-binding protein [Nitrosomonas sp.]
MAGELLDRLTHHVHILEMNAESYRLATSKKRQKQMTQTKPIEKEDTRPI